MRSGAEQGYGCSAEQLAVRTTIVGGRPPGSGKGVGLIPLIISILSFFSVTEAANDYFVKCGYDLTKWRPLIEEIKSTDKGRMFGFVMDIYGEPVYTAVVELDYKGFGFWYGTEDDGFYYADGIPVGVYDVKASRLGYEPVTVEGIVIKEDTATYVNFRLKKARRT